jgi:hypothetical protein
MLNKNAEKYTKYRRHKIYTKTLAPSKSLADAEKLGPSKILGGC